MGCGFALHRCYTCADRGEEAMSVMYSWLLHFLNYQNHVICCALRLRIRTQNRTDIIEHSEILGPHTLLFVQFCPINSDPVWDKEAI